MQAGCIEITGKKIKKLAGNRGYRGKKEVDDTGILIPDIPKPERQLLHTKKET